MEIIIESVMRMAKEVGPMIMEQLPKTAQVCAETIRNLGI